MDLENPKPELAQHAKLSLRSTADETQYDVNQETLVGREAECHISINSPHISRYHAKIVLRGRGAVIEDLNSSNGTYVNGKRINQKTAISQGDEIRFDKFSYRLISKDAGLGEATIIAPSVRPPAPSTPLASTMASKPEEPKAPATPEIPEDDDSTRMLSTAQVERFAAFNKQAQKISDKGSGPRFVSKTAPTRGKVYPLSKLEGEQAWRIGRGNDCAICVVDPSVSRFHATALKKDDGRFYIEASHSSGTLLVNGESTQAALLKHNDQLQIGHVEFIFRLDVQDITPSSILPEDPEVELDPKKILLIAGTAVVVVLAILTMTFAFK